MEDYRRSIYSALGMWWEGSRVRFPWLRIREGFLEEVIFNTSPNHTEELIGYRMRL